MRFKVATLFAWTAVFVMSAFAEDAAPAAEAPKENPELEAEIGYVEALVNYGYPDLAGPIIEATKKRWPASEVRFFAIEIRGLLALGQFEAAERKIGALPDRKSTKFWAARLEVANNYFGRGQKAECMKIYEEFFKAFPKPPADLRKFYMEACYAYGQLLVGDKQYVKAVQRYEALLAQLQSGGDEWCNVACETVEIYLRIVTEGVTDAGAAVDRGAVLGAANKIAGKLRSSIECATDPKKDQKARKAAFDEVKKAAQTPIDKIVACFILANEYAESAAAAERSKKADAKKLASDRQREALGTAGRLAETSADTVVAHMVWAAECAADSKKAKWRDAARANVRSALLASAGKIVDKLLWQLEKPVYFGRAVSMKAHIEQMKGAIEKATAIIDEYKPQLQEIHDQIAQFDPDGKMGLLKQSPLPECMYLQAKMLWDEAQAEYKKPTRDDEKVKVYMFGPKGKSGKRETAKGCFAMSQTVFLRYETSAWAPAAGDLAEAIKKFTKDKYGVEVKTKVTAEQLAKVRAAQFKDANEKFLGGQFLAAIESYLGVLAKYPEIKESVPAIENVASAYLDLILETKDEKKKDEYRMNADAVEGYLAERFAEHPDRLIMMAAGDATVRLAAKETQYKNLARADRLYTDFFTNYRRHTTAATLAAAKAMEFQKAERYEDAIKYWRIISQVYTNSSVYASSLAQLSYCSGKVGDKKSEIEYITAYLPIETVRIRRLQARFQLAQMYQKDGLAILAGAETNSAPEAVEADEKRGSAQIIRAIKEFTGFTGEADAALKDPSTTKEDVEKYKMLREAALFMVGECWSRMNRPEKNLPIYRKKAAESYEAYVAAYPEGKYAKGGYVKLGTIYTALGDMAKSKDALDRLSQKYPDSDEAKNAKPRLAKNLIEMGMKKEGAEIYGEMLRTDGSYSAQQFVAAGEALIDAKSWDLANQAFEKAIRLAGTNSLVTVAKARLGMAKSSWKQNSLAEAREALDQFLADPKMSKLTMAADANFMLVEIASEQGRTEKDATMRGKYFGAAIGALKKVRQYWRQKPAWEQDQLDLLSGDVLVDRMKAEEAMGLKEEAKESCGRAASTFQVFLQAHGVTDEHPLDKMSAGEVANLERAYATLVPLFTKLGAEQADRVMKFGQEYLDLFPNGKARTEIANCMNQAKADLPAGSGK